MMPSGIEANNALLKGVLSKEYARPALNKIILGELIDLISGIGMHKLVTDGPPPRNPPDVELMV